MLVPISAFRRYDDIISFVGFVGLYIGYCLNSLICSGLLFGLYCVIGIICCFVSFGFVGDGGMFGSFDIGDLLCHCSGVLYRWYFGWYWNSFGIYSGIPSRNSLYGCM